MIITLFLSSALLPALPIVGQSTRPSKPLRNQSASSDLEIASELKTVLQIGATNAVRRTGRPNGYFGNPAIKIPLPNNLRRMEKGLRAVGYGASVDALVLDMNRAAESAAPAAGTTFQDAIVSMSVDDARKILSGGDAVAREYLANKTTEQLTAAFRPIVERTMDQDGGARQYQRLVGKVQSIPFTKRQDLDITQYVVSKTLDGLFRMFGEDDRKLLAPLLRLRACSCPTFVEDSQHDPRAPQVRT